MVGLKRSFRALGHRNYRLFFAGQGVSLIGTWMTRVASSWLVYRLTNDPYMLGLVNFASLIPTFLLAPVAGAIVDRIDRHLLIVRCQVLSMVQSFALAALAFGSEHMTRATTISWLVGLNIFQAVVNAFDMPGRHAFLTRMVTNKADLPNAIALNSTMFHGARLIGPMIAGGIIAALGEVWCFALDGVTYAAVVWSLLAMRDVKTPPKPGTGEKLLASIKEGLSYVRSVPLLRAIFLQLAVFGFFGMQHSVLLPMFAKDILGGGAGMLGLLTGASGMGSVIGALFLASRSDTHRFSRTMVFAGTLFSLALMGFSFSHLKWLSAFLLVGTGFGMMCQMVSGNTMIQSNLDEERRGRVMSLYTSVFMGSGPIGGLVAGYLAVRIGVVPTIAASAVPCLIATLYFAQRLPVIDRSAEAAA